MAADYTTVAPGQAYPSGPGHRPTCTAAGSPGAFVGRDESAFHRATTGDYFGWLEHVRSAAGCSHPIRLAGEVATIDRTTGRLLASVATADLPDGEIYKPCGNRRHTVCPSCARTYQRDAYQLLRAGLAGGKGIPNSVAQHPAVFPTFTAPSFGTVHTRVVKRHTCGNRRRCDCRAEPCHPRRSTDPTARPCEHGQATVCWARHEGNDPRLGQPLCLDCYDYDAQVVWNHAAPELWRRTSIAITRHLNARARALGLPRVEQITESGRVRRVPPVKPSFGKVAEMQRRAVVHYHAVSLTLDDARALLAAAEGSSLRAYIVLSLLTGARTEELRALTWAHVDLTGKPNDDPPVPPSIQVWRSVRADGDTKTKKSRRTLALPARCVTALTTHREGQGEPPADRLVFTSAAGTALDRHNVLRAFRLVVAKAGLDPRDWTPRELRHSFVSLLSDSGVSIEQIADLCGHSGTTVTENVYRHQLRPVLLSGAVVMDRIFDAEA